MASHNSDLDDHISSLTPLLERPSSAEKKKSSFQAHVRLYWLAMVLCCGAVLFGYDSGLIGVSYNLYNDTLVY